jgi:hypothetical protein
MQRFTCPEVYSGSKLSDIFIPSLENRESIIRDGMTYVRLYQQYAEQNVITYYGTETCKAYFSSFNRNIAARLPSALATAIGITVDTTCLNSAPASLLTYIFDFTKIADLKESSFWFTIFADDGLHFCLPHRLTTSKEIKYNSVTQIYKQYLDPVFEGETADDYFIDLVKPAIRRSTITSLLKGFMIAKEKSKRDIVLVQSGAYATHNDYVSYNGKIYIIMSMLEDPVEGTRYYVAVKEELSTGYTFSGADITVTQYYNTSSETQTSASGKRFGINTASPDTALDVTKNSTDTNGAIFRSGASYNTSFHNSSDNDNVILPGTTSGHNFYGTLGFSPKNAFGFLGPGVDPSATVHISGGSTAAGSAPLKLGKSTNLLATEEAGAVQNQGKTLVLGDDSTSASLTQYMVTSAYGRMASSASSGTPIILTTGGAYYGVVTMTGSTQLRYVAFSDSTTADRLTISAGGAGIYYAVGNVSASASAGCVLHTSIFKNGAITDLLIEQRVNTGGDQQAGCAATVLNLAVNDYVDLRMMASSSGVTANIFHSAITLTRIGTV